MCNMLFLALVTMNLLNLLNKNFFNVSLSNFSVHTVPSNHILLLVLGSLIFKVFFESSHPSFC